MVDTSLIPWEQKKDKNGVEVMEGHLQTENRNLENGKWVHRVFTSEPAEGQYSHLMILREYTDGKLTHWETRLP